MASTITKRYYVLTTIPDAHTYDQLAAHWIVALNAATAAATPAGTAADATAAWVGLPGSTVGLTATYKDDTVVSPNIVGVLVDAGVDKTTTTTIVAGASTLSANIDAAVTTVPVAALPMVTAGEPYVVLVGTEKMLVTSHATLNLAVQRGYDGTTAATHTSGDAITQVIGPETTVFSVASGAAMEDEAYYKSATGGTEVWQVKSISTNLLTVERGKHGTTPVAITNGVAPFRIYGDDIYATALAAVNAEADGLFVEFGPSPTLA